MDNITCNLCGGVEFYKEAGFYYCNECQTQTQDIREQAQEEQYASQKSGRKIKHKAKPRDEQHVTSWECYNYILNGLVKELIEIGVSPELKTAVRILWFKFLKEIEFLTEEAADPPKLAAVYSQTDAEVVYGRKPNRRRSRSRSPASSSDITSTDTSSRQREHKKQRRALVKAEYDELASTQFSEEMTSLHNQSLSSLRGSKEQASKKLIIQFNKEATKELKSLLGEDHLEAHMKDFSSQLECHPPVYRLVSSLLITKDNMQLGDLLRYIREGHISYHKVDHFLPEDVIGKFTKRHLLRMNIQNSQFRLLHGGVRKMTAHVAKKINVVKYISVQNIEHLIKRYCNELNLPDEICMCAVTLVSLLKPRLKMWEHSTLIPNYEGRAMAFIIFVLKLLFGLDDESEFYLSDVARNINKYHENSKMFVYKDWMDYIQYRKLIASYFHFQSHIYYNNGDNFNKSELFIDFMQKQKNKFDDEEAKLTTEQEVLKSVLEKLERIQDRPRSIPYLYPSLTPFLSYMENLIKSTVLDDTKVGQYLLNKKFNSTTIEYLYSPYVYLQNIYKSASIGVKHRGVNNNLHLRKVLNQVAQTQMRNKRETKPIFTKIVKDEKVIDKHIDQKKSFTEKDTDLKEQATKLFLKLFEEYNLQRFRKNLKKMKKNASKQGIKIVSQTGKRSAHHSKKDEVDSQSSFQEKLHYNPFERYWMTIADVTGIRKSDFESFYKGLPYSFRLVFEECARIIEHSQKELYEEFNNVEVYVLFLENRGVVGKEKPFVFSNDDLTYLKDKVSRQW
ncbi:TATA box-binding protein-associated factor RNA polymerase I subunit B isoform X2 [Agrilus planipennis]|uniref:TATA box-binding protein-associated factor RNA polymerase I subunit B n=1 Tax=Agrilus planipennis TaxID=224129 RepID=A0A1W4WFD3_AGRPL|nr:TATA box-binding protein-associated factor RNA polymerase I subunit B isoform X2 [Agrilus planipennis]